AGVRSVASVGRDRTPGAPGTFPLQTPQRPGGGDPATRACTARRLRAITLHGHARGAAGGRSIVEGRGAGKDKVHWVVTLNRRNRSLFFALGLPVLGTHVAHLGAGPWMWTLLVLQLLVYP